MHCTWHKMLRKKLANNHCSVLLLTAVILNIPWMHRLEFCEMHAGKDVNYFDLTEDHLLAWDDVAYESIRNNRWSS